MEKIRYTLSFLLVFYVLLLFTPQFVLAGMLIQESHFVYEGAFRVPRNNLGGVSTYPQTLARGGAGLTYNPARDSLIMISRGSEKLAVEIAIPSPKIARSVSELDTANLLQAPGDITESSWDNLKEDGSAVTNGGSPGGLLVYNNRLIGSVFAFYDGSYEAARSHFTASLDWATTGSQFSGMYRVGINPETPMSPNGGFVGGYMAHVPPDWEDRLGFSALTGKGVIPVISRTSFGPCAWGFDPGSIGETDPVPATFLVGYPQDHQTLGAYGGTSLFFNMNSQLNGLVFPVGSDSLLFFGRHGLGMSGDGDACYGSGTSDIDLHGTPDGSGNIYCYDPADSSKGTHGYPYISSMVL